MKAPLKFLALICCTFLLSACGLFGALFVKPGNTVDLISASQYEVTYEYTHHYDSELPFAGRQADAQCQIYEKHSAIKQIIVKNIDRSMVIFRCE